MSESTKTLQKTGPRIIVGIPAYNEEQFVGAVVLGSRKYADQVIVVDDGSTDNTAHVAESSGARVIRFSVNRGYGKAIITCFQAAKVQNADVLVTLDGDGQHDPNDLPIVLGPILDGEADLIIGSRFLNRSNNIPGYRKFGINAITFLYNFGSSLKVSDSQSGFRAYNKRIMDVIYLNETGMGVSVEVIIQAREKGFRIKEIPIHCSYLPNSSTLNPLGHGLGVALTLVKLRFKNLLRRLIVGNN